MKRYMRIGLSIAVVMALLFSVCDVCAEKTPAKLAGGSCVPRQSLGPISAGEVVYIILKDETRSRVKRAQEPLNRVSEAVCLQGDLSGCICASGRFCEVNKNARRHIVELYVNHPHHAPPFNK